MFRRLAVVCGLAPSDQKLETECVYVDFGTRGGGGGDGGGGFGADPMVPLIPTPGGWVFPGAPEFVRQSQYQFEYNAYTGR